MVVVSASTEPEAFGRAVIEAQAMERVVIAAGHGGAGGRQWTMARRAGSCRRAMRRPWRRRSPSSLAMPEAERRAMGARARASVLARYTVQTMQQATLAVYEEVLRHRP